MKSYLLQAITAFLLLTPLLQAQVQQKKIIISSTTTELKAKQEFDKVHKYVSAYPKIISILKDNGINFTSRPSGNYHIVVMEPFSDKAALKEVTNILKKRYSGAYVNNYSPPATIQALPVIVEPVPTVSKVQEGKSIESTETAEPVKTKEVSVSEVEAVTVKEVVENETNTATTEALEDTTTETIEIVKSTIEETSNVVEEDSVESTVTEKEAFIVHKPSAEKEESHSVLPPWWVILSVLAIIFAAFNDTIEARRRK